MIDDNHLEARVPNGAIRGSVRVHAYLNRSESKVEFNPIVGSSALQMWSFTGSNREHQEAPLDRSDIIGTFAGFGFSAARHANGSLEVWGNYIQHQMLSGGTAIASLRSHPVYVAVRGGKPGLVPAKDGTVDKIYEPPPLGGVASITASRATFFALLTNNQVVAWPKSELSEVPRELAQGFRVMDITAGDSFAAALLRDGTIRVWGTVQGPVPVVPSPLPRMIKIRAASATLFALDTRGMVWALPAANPESVDNPQPLPLPWQMRDCVDIETQGVGVVALRRDGRWVTWNMSNGMAWSELEAIEPTACFSIGDTHALGLFERTIFLQNLGSTTPQLALEGASFTVKADVRASPIRQSHWVRTRDGIPAVVAEGDTLSLPAVTTEVQGQYTFVTANAFGVTRQASVSILAVPPPGIGIPKVSSSDGVPVVRITSPYIAYFPAALYSRWRLETAPTLEGPWTQARIDGMNFASEYGDFRCQPSQTGTGFFRVIYDDLGSP